MALKSVVEEALKANQEHRYSLKVYTERLEEELRTVDRLIVRISFAFSFLVQYFESQDRIQ